MPHQYQKILDDLCQLILAHLKERDIEADPEFITYAVHLLVRDVRCGIHKDLEKPTKCHVNTFIQSIVHNYLDLTNTNLANLRMSWIMKKGHGIKLQYVREQYEEKLQQQLKLLIDDILRYPETCSKVQLDQLFAKMQVFIVACYHLGCPKNHVLLKLTAEALNSVIGRSDLQNYVLKKKYHRQEYLGRLAATAAGIIIYNNNGQDGDRENVRYVTGDLKMAQHNTNEAFDTALERFKKLREKCQEAINNQLLFDTKETLLYARVPLEQLQRINQFTITFTLLERSLTTLKESYESTVYLVGVEKERYKCVISKIDNTLTMRTAIDAELIFPHFVYLAKVWSSLNDYFNHIVELNKLREQLESQVSNEMVEHCENTIEEIADLGKRATKLHESNFKDRMEALIGYKTDGDFRSLANADIKDFCGLTMSVTGGLLLPARVVRKLCMNLNIQFGFTDEKYARIGELWFENFIIALRLVIFNNVNLVQLFKLDDALLAKEFQPIVVEPPKTKSVKCQTENVVTNDLSTPNRINVTWNVWDYLRETIHLADIRRRQTRDTQTNVCYGQRNAQNQTYNTRHNMSED